MGRKEKIRVLHQGNTKNLWSTEEGEKLALEFKSVVYDEIKEENINIEQKGYYCAKISERLFDYLYGYWINTHCIHYVEDRKVLVHKSRPLPLKFTICNIATKHTAGKYGVEENHVFETPILEFQQNGENVEKKELNEEETAAHSAFKEIEFNRTRQLLFKANSVLRKYFSRRGLDLYQVTFELGILDNKPILIDELSPDVFVVKDRETNEYLGKYGVLVDEAEGRNSYRRLYEIIFAEEFQPKFERIKVIDETLKGDEIGEFEDEDIDLAKAEKYED